MGEFGVCFQTRPLPLFIDLDEAHFAFGIVAIGGTPTPGRKSEYAAYLRLRGNVYAHEMHYMPVEHLNADGTESDADDERSVHFAVFENSDGMVRAVGGMRLILKSVERPGPLPIERHYPEAFVDAPASLTSVEVSRLIGRHEEVRTQSLIKWPLFLAGVAWVLEHGFPDAYGVVERSLERRLRTDGVPVSELAGEKFVPEFNTINRPIRVDVPSLGARMSSVHPHLFDSMRTVKHRFVYSGTIPKVTLA